MELGVAADVAEVATEALVPEAGTDVGVAGDEPAAQALGVDERGSLAKRTQAWIGIGDEPVVREVERELSRPGDGHGSYAIA